MRDHLYQRLVESWEEVDTGIKYPHNYNELQRSTMYSFIDFCKTQLGVESLPKMIFSIDRSDADMTTGCFIPDQNVIYTYVTNRSFGDVCRTVAHELVHYKQYLENRLPEDLSVRNKEAEDEANCTSGDLVYNFAHADDRNKIIYDL